MCVCVTHQHDTSGFVHCVCLYAHCIFQPTVQGHSADSQTYMKARGINSANKLLWYRPVDSWTDRVLCSACVHYCICLCLSVCKPYVWWYCTRLVYLEGWANTSSKHKVFSFHSGLHSQTQSETHTVSTHQVWNTFCVCLQLLALASFF